MCDGKGGGVALCQQSCPKFRGKFLMNYWSTAETVLQNGTGF